MEIKFPVGSQISVDSCLFSKTKCKISKIFTFKDSIHSSFVLALLKNFHLVAIKSYLL